MPGKHGRYIHACFALVALLPGPILAADSGCGKPASAQGSGADPETDHPAGQTIYVDPDTGELVDPPVPAAPDEAQQAQVPRPPEPDLPVVRLPDGTVRADVGDRFVTELRVEVRNGQVVTCHRPVAPKPEAPEATASVKNGGDDG